MFTRTLSAAALAAALLPGLAPAATLTFAQALDLATERSRSAAAARAGAAGAAEAERAAGQLPDPVLSAGIDNLPVAGPDRFRTAADSMTMKRLGLSQEWVSHDKRARRQDAARTQLARESARERIALGAARMQTALAYLDAFFAGRSLELASLAARQVHEELEAARARLASSAASSQEVLAITAARGVAEDEVAELQQVRDAAGVALRRWTGVAGEDLSEPVLPAVPPEQAFVAAHPSVVAAGQEVQVARSEAAVAAANRMPNWTWQVSYGQRSGFPDMASIGVSIPLPIRPGERQDRETAARLALVDRAEAELEEARRTAAAEYRTLASDARRIAQRLENYRSAVVAPAQQRVQAALAGYRSNQVALVALFEARQAEVAARRKLLDLQRELARARAQLGFKPTTGVVQ